MKKLIVIICLIPLFLSAQNPPAQDGLTQTTPYRTGATPELTWDLHPEPSVTHYTLYEWGSGTTPTVFVATISRPPFTVPSLTSGLHSFTVTAVNEGGESPHSNRCWVMVVSVPGPWPGAERITIVPKKLAELDDKLKVKKADFIAFKTGIQPNYPEADRKDLKEDRWELSKRILRSRDLLELSMNQKEATFKE